jgi:hypothetical protein
MRLKQPDGINRTMSAPATTATTTQPATEVPKDNVLRHAAKIAMERDKPILLDYYRETLAGTAFLGQDKETGEKILVKSPEEYTSPVLRMLNATDAIIVETENSLYIVAPAATLKKKQISTAGM